MKWEFKTIHSQKEKDHWNVRFREEYDSNMRPYDADVRRVTCDHRSKYIRVESTGNSVGYARIAIQPENIAGLKRCRVWVLEEMLIEHNYRHNGAAAALIEHLRDYRQLDCIHVTDERAARLRKFHEKLGFGVVLPLSYNYGMAHVYNTARFKMLSANHGNAANDNRAAEKKFMIPMTFSKNEAA